MLLGLEIWNSINKNWNPKINSVYRLEREQVINNFFKSKLNLNY